MHHVDELLRIVVTPTSAFELEVNYVQVNCIRSSDLYLYNSLNLQVAPAVDSSGFPCLHRMPNDQSNGALA